VATAHFRQTLEIRAQPAAVHALLTDLDQLRVLHPLIESVRELPPRAEQPDARRYRVVDQLRLGPLRLRTAYTAELRAISETEIEGRAWQSPAIALHTIYRLAASALGTRLTESTELRAPWLLRSLVRRQAEAAHRGMLEHLKAQLESPQTGARRLPK
jgi:carbon monoxide dehydrogenase subunit G